MAPKKEGLWNIASGLEVTPDNIEADHYTKFVEHRDRALAAIVLSVEPSLLYLIGEPAKVWKVLADQFERKTRANKLDVQLNKMNFA